MKFKKRLQLIEEETFIGLSPYSSEVKTQQGLALSPFTLVQNTMQGGAKSQPIRVMDHSYGTADFPLEENDLATSFKYVQNQTKKRSENFQKIADNYNSLMDNNSGSSE